MKKLIPLFCSIFCLIISINLRGQTDPSALLQQLRADYNKMKYKEISFDRYVKYRLIQKKRESNGIQSFFNGCSAVNQTMCGGGNFEKGIDVSQWQGAYGSWETQFDSSSLYPDPAVMTAGFLSGSIINYNSHHTIVDSGRDPITNISLTAPNGGRHSLRLGNSYDNYGTEMLSKTITVSPSETIFSFWYALVLQNPADHPFVEQPAFSVRVYDCATGKELKNVCNLGTGTNLAVADRNNPFFRTIKPTVYDSIGGGVPNEVVVYHDWSCAQINLGDYVGKKVNIIFTNKDCGYGAHFGYTYLDNFCTTCEGSPTGYIFTPEYTYTCGTGKICGRYTLPRTETLKGQINISLDIYQNKIKLKTLKSGLLRKDSSQYCFDVDPKTLGIDTTLKGFDYILTGNFFINDTFGVAEIVAGFPPDGIRTGDNNDYKVRCISATIKGNKTVCQNDSTPFITFKGINGVPPYTFTYNINGGSNVTITTKNGDSVKLAAPTNKNGTYIYNLLKVYDDDRDTLVVSGSSKITVNALPDSTVKLSRSTTFCEGDSIVLTASPGNTYLWSNNATTQSIVVKKAGTYIVTITNKNGCTAVSAPVTITVNALPTATITSSGPLTFCQGGSAILTASAGKSYHWSTGDTTRNIAVSTTGNYTVTITNVNGCSAISPAIQVTVNPLPVVDVKPSGPITNVCPGTLLTLTATGGFSSYLWNNKATSQSITVTAAGQYFVKATNENGCTNTSDMITVTFAVPVVPAVSITSLASANTICAGTKVIFTALPVNGGPAPAFQWKKNGNAVGVNSLSYTDSLLNDGDSVWVILTSNATCLAAKTAVSNGIKFRVNPNLIPAVDIKTNTSTTICAGTKVIFTAIPDNGGTAPFYQWKKNGKNTGTNNITYVDSLLNDGDSVSVELTSSGACLVTKTANSPWLKFSVNPGINPSVTIKANTSDTICTGTKVTFTAVPLNAGKAFRYQWRKNDTIVGANSITYIDSTLDDGDYVKVTLISNAACVADKRVTSNGIKFTVKPGFLPSVIVKASPGSSICAGTKVTLTATPVNGGTTPVYQWKKNGKNVGTNSMTYTDSLVDNGDSIACTLQSNIDCALVNTVTSTAIIFVVSSVIPLTPVIAGPATVKAGSLVGFRVTPVKGEVYLWQANMGDSIVSGQGTDSVVIKIGSVRPDSLRVAAVNGCGISAYGTKRIAVSSFAARPAGFTHSVESPMKASLYPNPAANAVSLKVSGGQKKIRVSLTYPDGRVLWQKNATTNTILSLPSVSLSSGTYFITVSDGKENRSLKLIISK